eukprot:1884893-Pyramimonas_sp.AAC.1
MALTSEQVPEPPSRHGVGPPSRSLTVRNAIYVDRYGYWRRPPRRPRPFHQRVLLVHWKVEHALPT